MDIGNLLSLAGGATPWGALLGGVFGVGKKWLDDRREIKMAEMEQKEKALDRQHDLDLIDKEIVKETAIATMDLQETMFKTDSLALRQTSASQDREISALGSVLENKWIKMLSGVVFVFVTAVQKLTRPALTASLFALTCFLFIEVNKMVGGLGIMTAADLTEIYRKIIFAVISMTELAITFWFVSRPGKR